MLNGRAPESVQRQVNLSPQDAPDPPLDPDENVRVTSAGDDSRGPGHHTHSETSVCADGNNVMVSFNTNGVNTNAFSGFAVSSDAGRTFRTSTIPDIDMTTLGDGVVALGTRNLIYYATLMLVNGISAVGVSKSVEGTFGFSRPVDASAQVENKVDFQDKESLAVDRNATSPFQGNVYVAWTDFSDTTFIEFARSVDFGGRFQNPVTISIKSNSNAVQGSNIAVGPKGEVYVAFSDREGPVTAIGFVKSLDGGLTWTRPKMIAFPLNITQVPAMDNVRANSFPRMAVGPDGTIHVVYGAQPATLGPDRSDVFYIRSKDGGDTFSAPLRMNDDATTKSQIFPSLAITDSGAVGVEWWDMRNSPEFGSLTDVYMAISNDGGDSFSPNFRVTNHSFVFTPIDRGLAGGYHSDYNWMTASGETFLAVWSDEFYDEPDAFLARVPATRDPLAPDFVVSSGRLYDSVIAGNQTDYPFKSSAIGGFSDQLAFSVSPQVPGIEMSFGQATAAAGQPVTLHVATAAGVQPGSYLFAVAATGGGKTRASSFWLTVLSPSAPYVSPPSNITNTAGYTFLTSQPQVDSSGKIHVVFYDDTDLGPNGSKVYYTRSDDGGRSYSTPVQLSRDGEGSTLPILKVDSHGNLFVAWQYLKPDFQNGTERIVKANVAVTESSDGGRSFSAPQDVTTNSIIVPAIGGLEIFEDGGIVVTYTAAAVGGQRLYAARSDDSGKSFGQPVQISVTGQAAIFPESVSDGRGTIFAIYAPLSIDTLNTPLFASKSSDGGRTFSPAAMISPPDIAIIEFSPVLAMSSDGKPYVLYHSFNTQPDSKRGFILITGVSISLITAPDDTHFTPPTLIAAGVYAPAMLLDKSDNIYISFVALVPSASRTPQQVMVTRSYDKGASFSIPVRASDETSLAVTASAMQLDPSGNLSLSWMEGEFESSFQAALTTSIDGGVTFGPVANVSASPGQAAFPFLAGLPDGTTATIYQDDSPQNRDLFSAVIPAPMAGLPDFAVIDQALTVRRGATGKLVLSISRPGGFAGNVTVTAPTGLPRGITIAQPHVTTSTTNATFDLTVEKRHVNRGTVDLTFTARDESGRQKSGTIRLTVE
jgi:hypothetical protein